MAKQVHLFNIFETKQTVVIKIRSFIIALQHVFHYIECTKEMRVASVKSSYKFWPQINCFPNTPIFSINNHIFVIAWIFLYEMASLLEL